MQYPASPKGDVVETLHGARIADPYRWLEDADSPETRAWVEAQNAVTHAYLGAIPARQAIREDLERRWNYERYERVFERGGRTFHFRNDGLQNQSVLYVEERVLLDPNGLSEDGTVALNGAAVSRDGNRLAYALSRAGSDWQEWRVRDVATGEDLPDRIEWSKFSGASWAHDGSGFYYSAYDPPAEGEALQGKNLGQRLYFHRLGTAQADDALVYERPDQPEWGFGGHATDDGRYLIVSVWHGTHPESRAFVKRLDVEGAPVRELLAKPGVRYDFVTNEGTRLYFETDDGAPRGRVVAVDAEAEAPTLETVVPEGEDALVGVVRAGAYLFATTLQDVTSHVRQFDLEGNPKRTVALPGLGSAGFGGAEKTATATYYGYTSYTTPSTVYRFDLETGASTPFRTPDVPFKPDRYETTRRFYTSRDGTRIPLFVTHRKGLALDGANPTLLYGYGGFNASLTPGFSPAVAAWLDLGGVYAVANIRGGGEYGKPWHDAGRLRNKQNCYDDFVAAAEFLIAEGYTSPAKLACRGGSNGGLLVGAVVNQRPDLWAAALPAVGVMDLLRFHRFTIGWAWTSDFGSPDDPEDFPHILAISPLHNLREGVRYPAIMVTTGDHDDRVVPAHSYKYAAALQALGAGPGPYLIRIDVSAGHGAGKPTRKRIEEIADEWAFLVQNLGMA